MRLVAVLCYYIKVFVRQFYVYSIEQSIFARIEHVKLKYATVCLNGNVTEPKINLIFIVEKYILYRLRMYVPANVLKVFYASCKICVSMDACKLRYVPSPFL
jgi:hypothetical protein